MNLSSKNQGFTLVELAIVVLISGIFTLVIGAFFKSYTSDLQRQTTIENIDITHTALLEYFGRNGVYPCPADPTLGPGDANYGVARCRDYASPTFDPDNCVDLVPIGNIECTTNNSRDADVNGSNDIVMMGIIPFRTLADSPLNTPYREAHRKDGYNTMFSYAVTESMTNDVLFAINNPAESERGAIRVIDENDIPVTDPDDSAHYVLYSHGMNRRGGYSPNGQQIDNCNVTRLDMTVGVPLPGGPTTAPPGTDIEIENCDYNDAIFTQAIFLLNTGGNYTDDILLYRTRAFRQFWRSSFVEPNYIFNTNFGNVGVGTDTPTERLHIRGDLTVDEDVQSSGRYCDGALGPADPNSDCLDAAFLGGNEVATTVADVEGRNLCPVGQAAYAIGDDPSTPHNGAEIICRDVDWTPITKTCAPIGGQPSFLRGISNLGNIVCCTYQTNSCATQ